MLASEEAQETGAHAHSPHWGSVLHSSLHAQLQKLQVLALVVAPGAEQQPWQDPDPAWLPEHPEGSAQLRLCPEDFSK